MSNDSTETEQRPAVVVHRPVGLSSSVDIPTEIRALMDSDRADAEKGLWWMIEHPEINAFYWSLLGWQSTVDGSYKFTTKGEAEMASKRWKQLSIDGFRVTQHAPAYIQLNAQDHTQGEPE